MELNPIRNMDFAGDTPHVSTRIWGGIKVVGGVLGATGSAAVGLASSWTGIGAVAGGAGVIYSADVTSSGLRQLWSGQEEQSFTQKVISLGLQKAGVSKINADVAGGYVGFGLGFTIMAGEGLAQNGPYGFGQGSKVGKFTTVEEIVPATRGRKVGEPITNLTKKGKYS